MKRGEIDVTQCLFCGHREGRHGINCPRPDSKTRRVEPWTWRFWFAFPMRVDDVAGSPIATPNRLKTMDVRGFPWYGRGYILRPPFLCKGPAWCLVVGRWSSRPFP